MALCLGLWFFHCRVVGEPKADRSPSRVRGSSANTLARATGSPPPRGLLLTSHAITGFPQVNTFFACQLNDFTAC